MELCFELFVLSPATKESRGLAKDMEANSTTMDIDMKIFMLEIERKEKRREEVIQSNEILDA